MSLLDKLNRCSRCCAVLTVERPRPGAPGKPAALPRCRRTLAVGLLCVLGVGLLSGCQSMYFLTDPEKTETVEAEYGKISDRTVAVLVWADQSIHDEFPRATRSVCRAVTHYMTKNLPKADIVSARKVGDFTSDTGRAWEEMSDNEICKALDCELVLRIDLLEFTSRASDTPELRKARIDATLNLYECGEEETLDAVYEDELKVTFPPKSLHGVQSMSEADLIHEVVEHFSQVTSRKFHAHEVKMQDAPRKW